MASKEILLFAVWLVPTVLVIAAAAVTLISP